MKLVLFLGGKKEKLKTHMQFFFNRGGGIFTIIYSSYDDEKYPYHLVSLVNHEIVQSYDELPTVEQLTEEIGEFNTYHTDKVTIDAKKKH